MALGIFQHLETARLVESGCLYPRIRCRNRQSDQFHASMELMLFVGGRPDSDLKFTTLITVFSIYAKHVALVAVVPLVERPN